MKITQRILNKFGYGKIQDKAKTKKEVLSWDDIPESSGFTIDPVTMSVAPSLKTADYLNSAVGWVYAAVSVIADEVATIDIRLFKKKDGKIEEVFDHAILDFLNKVNSFTTKFDHFWLTQEYLELTGEAPWLIVMGLDEKPEAMFLLRPDRLAIKFNEDKNSQKVIDKYIYTVGPNKTEEFEPEEIIFLKYPNPTIPFRGRGTLEAAAKVFNLDKFSEDWNVNFFFNAARPDAILTTDKTLTDVQIKRLKDQWKKNFKGIENRAKLAVLEAGLDYKPLQMTQKDMDFIEQQRFSRDKIFSIFRVPKTVVAITDQVNLANAETGALSFARWTIRPKMQRIIEQLNEFLVPLFNEDGLFLDFVDPVPENTTAKTDKYDSALKSGWMTPNEVRKEENLVPIEGGDELYLPGNVQPIGSIGEEEKSNEDNKNINKAAINVTIPRKGKKSLKDLRLNKSIVNIIKSHLGNTTNKQKVKHKKKTIKEIKDLEGFWNRQIEIQEKYEKRLSIKLKDLFADQEKDILRQLSDVIRDITAKYFGQEQYKQFYWKDIKVDIPRVRLDIKKENKKFVSALEPVIKSEINDAGAFTLLEVGSSELFQESDEVIKYLKTKPIKFANKVNVTTNKNIRRTLANGIKLGEGADKLKKRIKGVFKQAKTDRADNIARTESSRAANFATVEAYKQSGEVKGKKWLTAFDERTCEWCPLMDGKIVEVNESFFEEGDEFKGIKGGVIQLDYDTVGYPPLHPRCRCTVVPVLDNTSKEVKDKIQEKIKIKKRKIFDRKIQTIKEKYRKEVAERKIELENMFNEKIKKVEEDKTKDKTDITIKKEKIKKLENEKAEELKKIREVKSNLIQMRDDMVEEYNKNMENE